MKCPQCERSEVDPTGNCPACGFHGDPAPDPPKAPEATQEVPAWRTELSRRLAEIKEKRGAGEEARPETDSTPPLPFPKPETPAPKQEAVLAAETVSTPKPSRRAVAAGKTSERARAQRAQAAPVLQAQAGVKPESAAAADLALKPSTMRAASSGEVRHLIDDAVSLRPAQSAVPEEEPDLETRLVLLSRTLSGMIDLLAVFICTALFIVAEDFFSGLEMFDGTSFLNAGLVFLALFLLYSLFFLGTSNQTIGMMITHLRLVGKDGKRPPMELVISRCAIFVPSLLVLGAGLLWGCFDREAMCLHDRLSGTRVHPVAL